MSTQSFLIGTNWEVIHDSTVSGTFTGFLQKVSGNNTVFCFIGDTAPLITDKGFSAIEQSLDVTVLSANNEKLWVRASAYNAILSLNPVAASSISGTVAATQSGTWNITNISGTVSLPTGASTSALQTTANTSLSSIDGKLPTAGQKTMANSQPVTIASDQSIVNMRLASSATTAAAGLFATTTAYGVLRVSPETSTQFFDAFDTDDTTNNWTLKNATGTSSVASGVLTCASSTTANAYGGRFSIPTIRPRGINFVGMGLAVRFNNLTIANTARWIGIGSLPTTPTTTAPVTDGIGFLLDGSGNLFGKIYSAGVEVGSVDLTAYKPANNAWTRLAVTYRSDIAYFYVATTEIPVGSISFTNPAIQTLPLSIISIAGAVAPVSTATIDVMAWGVGDTGRNQQGICDPDFPTRTATVKLASTATATTDKPLVVANHPLSPAYQRPIDNVVSTVGTSGAALTATLPAAGAGLKHYITKIEVIAFAAVARIASGTPVTVTTTNIPSNPSFTFKSSAFALGDSEVQDKNFVLPLATTTANTATTIVCPATTSVIWRINVFYYIAP